MTGSVVVGSQVLASADDTTAVWAARGELAQGQAVTASDLVQVRVRFAQEADASRYVTVDDAFPADITLSRPLGAGELLPLAALGGTDDSATVAVAIALAPEEVPHGLRAGSKVDVWVVGEGRNGLSRARVALEDIAVIAVPTNSGAFGSTTAQQVVLAIPQGEDGAIAKVLGAAASDDVRLVGRGES